MYPIFQIRNDIDDVFRSLSCCAPRAEMGTAGTSALAARNGVRKPGLASPTVRVWEDNESYVLEAEVPGSSVDKIDISVEGNVLSIHGTRESVAHEGKKLIHQDRSFSEFERTLSFGSDIDSTKVTATFKDGILTVSLPKSEKSKSRKVPISVQ